MFSASRRKPCGSPADSTHGRPARRNGPAPNGKNAPRRTGILARPRMPFPVMTLALACFADYATFFLERTALVRAAIRPRFLAHGRGNRFAAHASPLHAPDTEWRG